MDNIGWLTLLSAPMNTGDRKALSWPGEIFCRTLRIVDLLNLRLYRSDCTADLHRR